MTVVPSVIVLLFFAFITYPTVCESLKCYECSGKKSCGGQGHTDHIVECAGKCMIYQNDDDDGKEKYLISVKSNQYSKFIHRCSSEKLLYE